MIYYVLRFLSYIVCKLLFRVELTGREHIPKEGGLLVVCNHISYLDPVTFGGAFPRPLYFLTKSEFYRHRFFGWLLRKLHTIPIHLDRYDKQGMQRAIEILREGKALVVYPEGARSRDGKLHPGRAGAGFLAIQAGVPVLPVYLRGTYEALPPRAHMIRLHKIFVHIGQVLDFSASAPPAASGDGPKPLHPHGQLFYQGISDRMMEAIRKISEDAV
ncbi:MAG: lysophospholipid acyltransferase family protein [Candidatus Omnitrophota bacterium]